MQNGLKKLLRLVITVAVIFLAVRWCSSQFGSVIRLPGGSGDTGGTIGSGKGSSEESGGWFSPKKQNDRSTTNEDLIEDVEDLERELGIGKYKGQKDFAGYSGCKVTPSGNPVQEVRVDFPVISDWDALEKAYDNLQADLTRKYGIDPVVNRNLAVYNLPNGTISLDADVSNQSNWHVILKYTNAFTTSSTGTLGRNPIDDL